MGRRSVEDLLHEEFRSNPKFAADTQSPTGVVARDNRTTSYYFRRRYKLPNLESLPDELLLGILVRLPAHVIQDSVGLVCPKWYHLTRTRDFIHEHFQRATSGLILHSIMFPEEIIFISMKEGQVEKFRFRKEYDCNIWSSCNGLVFGISSHIKSDLCIFNPATNQHYDLPPIYNRICSIFFSCLAFAAASKEYKVVLCHQEIEIVYCAIVTVGVDTSWRHVPVQHLSETSRTVLCKEFPWTTQGFVHWIKDGFDTMLTLNVEIETISESQVPLPLAHRGKRKFYLPTERYLTVLVALGKYSWDVWQMESETGEWLKVFSIDLEDEKWRFDWFSRDCDENYIRPVGWIDYPDVLVFNPPPGNRSCIVYKVRTREIDSFIYQHWVDFISLDFTGVVFCRLAEAKH